MTFLDSSTYGTFIKFNGNLPPAYNGGLSISDELYELNRNKRAELRDALVMFVNNVSVASIDNIRMQASTLSTLTGIADEITRELAVKKEKKISKLSNHLKLS
jgi:hypothetical protein